MRIRHLLLHACFLAAQLTAAAIAGSEVAREGFVTVAGARLQYVDWGGGGEPIVLVAGRCQTPYVFGDLAALLQSRFRVLGLTPRGCRQSGAAEGYDVDRQIDELVGFLDVMGIRQAAFAGHSSGAGKVVRLARRYPERVSRVVLLDTIYAGVPDEFETRMDAAIAERTGRAAKLTLESHRAEFRAWELGAWSAALEREFREQTEVGADGGLRYRQEPPAWRTDFARDIAEGKYFESVIRKPALVMTARDLDLNRARQFPKAQRRALEAMARDIGAERRKQMRAFQRNGPHVRVRWMPNVSHYLFVDQPGQVAAEMIRFLERKFPETSATGR